MIRVLVADDHEILRWGLVTSLSRQPDLVVVGEVGDTAAAIEASDRLAPDVLLLDLSMPGGGGWVVLERVLADRPEACVVIHSATDDAPPSRPPSPVARGRTCRRRRVRRTSSRCCARSSPACRSAGGRRRQPTVPAARRQRAAPAVATRAPADQPPSKRYCAWAR